MNDAVEAAGPTRSRHQLLAISGSLRAGAFSLAVLKSLAESVASQAEFTYADIGELPHFNEDFYAGTLPSAVTRFRSQVEAADGLVIASPEYNHGIPGVLKNAFDWASRPHNRSPLRNKPFLIVTSSLAFTGGVRAQYQIRESLVSALARPVSTPELVIGEVGKKIVDGRFEDVTTMAYARDGFAALFGEIARQATSGR